MFKRLIVSEEFQIYIKRIGKSLVFFNYFFFSTAYLTYRLRTFFISLMGFGLQIQRAMTQHKIY